jgi:hypothetical protein
MMGALNLSLLNRISGWLRKIFKWSTTVKLKSPSSSSGHRTLIVKPITFGSVTPATISRSLRPFSGSITSSASIQMIHMPRVNFSDSLRASAKLSGQVMHMLAAR